MERTFLETVHFLGLDMEVAVVAVMAALQALLGLAERVRVRRIASRPPVARSPLPPVTVAWPPNGWKSSH
jgi:hypothetical protein